MILRIVIIFLIFVMAMAMIQKALGRRGRGALGGRNALDRLRCPTCKRVNFSNNPAPCDRSDCRYN